MTTAEFIQKQKGIYQQIIQKDVPLRRAAASTLAMQATRIFVNGENSDGGSIGQYNSTKPLYVNPNIAAGAAKGNKKAGVSGLGKPIGKTGRTTFSDGRPHKTVWVSSYKDFKGKIGQKNDKVRLVLSGDLRSNFSSSHLEKVSAHEYITGINRGEANINKAEGLQRKYGPIFFPTKKEIDNFFTRAQQEYNLIIANTNA